jgi:hypothetical protein
METKRALQPLAPVASAYVKPCQHQSFSGITFFIWSHLQGQEIDSISYHYGAAPVPVARVASPCGNTAGISRELAPPVIFYLSMEFTLLNTDFTNEVTRDIKSQKGS